MFSKIQTSSYNQKLLAKRNAWLQTNSGVQNLDATNQITVFKNIILNIPADRSRRYYRLVVILWKPRSVNRD